MKIQCIFEGMSSNKLPQFLIDQRIYGTASVVSATGNVNLSLFEYLLK